VCNSLSLSLSLSLPLSPRVFDECVYQREREKCVCVFVHSRPWIYGAKMLFNLARALASGVNEPIAVAAPSRVNFTNVLLRSGVNFINVLRAAFAPVDPKKHKKILKT